MKPTKVAAAVAGSLLALGVAAPAMAAESPLPTSLDGGLGALTGGLKTDALSNTTEGSPVKAVTDTAEKVNEVGKGGGKLLGGLPVGASPLGVGQLGG
ncbi:hypothetical protein KV205_31195 [Streptomyces sp. SKN60]|uniref:hypothetical protein n=1 Tax=Streptomyces sp. SKN60 TaxID=2855506 RepID=UPI002245B8A1|nr:hypothetical protein [Streptomyces sp. SKN60]MCX2184960.1 hypothetical protein [Streptomyces sp. SKN60]